MKINSPILLGLIPSVLALGQNATVTLNSAPGLFQLAGSGTAGQILLSANDWWGVIRAAQDLAGDFGKVTGRNLTLGNWQSGGNYTKKRRDVAHGQPGGGGPPSGEPNGGGWGWGGHGGHAGGGDPSSESGGHNSTQTSGRETTVIYTYHPPTNNINYTVGPAENFTGPTLTTDTTSKTVIIAGTINKSDIINSLVASGKLNISRIHGKWESFISTVISNPLPGIDKALVIAGSDLRGTVYGLYDVSEQIGVSPWWWWADVPSRKVDGVWALNTTKVQGSPSVKYRGIFLNDEQPALTNWINENYAPGPYGPGFNHYFHSHVFELLLRLRANYFWPAEWASMFFVDDYANQPLADAYGIVMGTSHTEPMMRASNEWGTFGSQYGGNGQWEYDTNNASISKFFEYGAQRAAPYVGNSLFTMAMRGTGDTAITLTQPQAIVVLENVVAEQRKILGEVFNSTGVSVTEIPQMWCLYKEVLGYFEAGMTVPDDITLLYADDNWGNTRRLPVGNETGRSGGAGVYYHFDYVGDPRDYKWINTLQLEKTVEQMQLAYARQADRIWILNVGDLKPLEIPITHFMDLAYDTPKWGYSTVPEWLSHWATREFGPQYAENISSIVDRYGMYAARRKYELLDPTVYSVNNYNEADAVLAQWSTLANDAQAIYDKLDSATQIPFFEMVLHPILAGQIVTEIYVGAAKNIHYVEQKRNSANTVAQSVLSLFNQDHALTQRYHDLLNGKWNHMLDQTHLGYDYWQQPMRNALPPLAWVQELETSLAGNIGVGIEASNATVSGDDNYHSLSSDTLTLPPMDRYGPKTRWIDIFARGPAECSWTIASSKPYITVSPSTGTSGGNGTDTRVFLSVDWASVNNSTTVNLNVNSSCGSAWGNYGPPTIQLPIVNTAIPSNFSGFVESDRHLSIEAEHTSLSTSVSGVSYLTLPGLGRTLSGVTLSPVLAPSQSIETGPVLEYDVYTFTGSARVNVTLFITAALNQMGSTRPLKYAVGFDGDLGEVQTVQFVANTTGADGAVLPAGWAGAVSDGVWGVSSGNSTTTTHNLSTPGAHTLKIWALEPGVIIQKIVVDLGGVRPSYLGPPESFRAGVDTVWNGETGYDGTNFAGVDVGKVV